MKSKIPLAPAMANRAAWLLERKQGIGSSDAGPVAGVSPYAGPLDVYLDKTGLLVRNNDSFRMDMGLMMEPILAQLYSNRTGKKLLRPHPNLKHPERPWQLANLDFIDESQELDIELKTVDPMNSKGWGPDGSDEIPDHYRLQVTQQMDVTGLRMAHVGALFGLREFRIYKIGLDQNLADLLADMESDLWQAIQARQPPPIDWEDPRTPELVRLMNHPTGGQTLLDSEAAKIVNEYQAMGKDISVQEKERDILKARIFELMGSASEGLLPDGRIVYRKEVNRAGYTCQPCKYVNISIKEKK